jgi:hypothetical protein
LANTVVDLHDGVVQGRVRQAHFEFRHTGM